MQHLDNKGKVISAASTNATVLKSRGGLLGFLSATNSGAGPAYLKIYDKGTTPVVGTDTPVFTFLIPGNTSGAGSNLGIPFGGIDFGAGISIAITGGVADSNTTPVNANEIIVNYGFK